MKYREVIVPDCSHEEWKEIKLNIGGSHSTLQDIKVQKQAAGFCYKNDEYIRNRFIYWRTSDDVNLELSENSLDVNLKNKNLRLTFEESPILSVHISENQDHVIVLVATISNIHRFQFIHPRRNIGANGEQNENSIFSSITQESVKDPSSYYTISNLLAQNVPHCAASYLSLTSEEAYFAIAHINHLLLFQMNCFTGHTGVTELKNFQIFPKIFSNISDVIRGKNNVNDSSYVTSMVFDTIGGENVLYALYRDNHIRMWSTRTGQCLCTLNICKDNDERKSQGTQNNILKKASTSNSICVFLSYGNGSEFQLFKPTWDGASSFSIVPTNLITAPQFDLVDFELTDQKLWGLWCNSEGDMHISAYALDEPVTIDCWRTAILEGISGKRRTVEAEMDAKHIYCSNIFRPGKFQTSTISKALMMFSRSTNYSDAFTPMQILKERVCQAIDAEIQNEMKMHDLSEDEYIEVAINNWEKFYSCCEQYHIAAHQPVGIFVLDSLDAVCVIKTSLMSFLRPCDIIENMLLSGLCPDEFANDDRLEEDLSCLVKTLYYLENNLSMDVKIEISNNLFKLKMANVIISDLISSTKNYEDFDVTIPRELIEDVAERLRPIRDVQSTVSILLNLLRLDKNNFKEDEFNEELSIFQKQLFGGNYGISLVSETVRQISSSRFAMCRNLLIVQNILIDGYSLNCNEGEIIRSKHIPETVIFLQAYYVMVWIGEDAFGTPQAKVNVVGFSSQGGYSQSSSLLQLFVRNRGLQNALKLYFNLDQMDDDNNDYETENFWSKNLLIIASYIERFIWAISGRFIFGEWLSTTHQHLLIEEYVRLLNEWCEYNSCSRQFILALSFLETGESNKAFDMFIKSAKGVLSEPFISNYVGAQELKSTNEILAQYYLKVMRLFEKYEIYDCVINIAETAIGTADKDSQLAMFQSIIFNNHMHLKHYEEAYHSLIHNVELSRRKDCLRQLVIMLFQEKRFDILINFPYNGLEQDLQNIVETRARSMQIENNEHYNFLYSYHIKTNNMKRASIVMYEKALRYLYEGGTYEALQQRYNSLLACYNALLLVDPDYRWIAKPVIEDPKNDEEMDDVMESDTTPQIEVIDVNEIRKEMLIAEALLCIAKAKDLKLIMQMGPKELVVLLSTQRFYTNALKLAKGYKLSLTPIFESLTLACIKSTNIEFNDNLDWLNQNNLSDLTLTVKCSEMPWIYLRKLLKEEDPERQHYRDVVKQILANQAFIPQWLLDSYKKHKPSELLYLYLQYGRLDEAAELAIDFVRAYLGYGNEIFGFKCFVAKTHPSFPINTMDLLLHQLKIHGEKDKICQENYALLKESIDEYVKTADPITLESMVM